MVKTLQIQKLWMYILSIILFSFYSANAALCATNVNVENKIDRSTKLKMYSNLETGAIFIKVKMRDTATNQTVNIIVENYEFAAFLAIQKGLKIDKFHKFIDKAAFNKFVKEEYVDWMLKNEGKTLEIDLGTFKKYIAESLGENASAMFYENTYTYEQLGVENEQELVEKYFDYDSKICSGKFKQKNGKKQNQEKLSYPAFIATFIDLGYTVGWEDFGGSMYIFKVPCPASTTTQQIH